MGQNVVFLMIMSSWSYFALFMKSRTMPDRMDTLAMCLSADEDIVSAPRETNL